MNPLYRRTYMRIWIDAMAEGYSTNDARALAEIEAREAEKSAAISESNGCENRAFSACACEGKESECAT